MPVWRDLPTPSPGYQKEEWYCKGHTLKKRNVFYRKLLHGLGSDTGRFYSDCKDYDMAPGLVDETERITRITGCNDKLKNRQLIGPLPGIAAKFTEELIQYQNNWWDWETVKVTFIQIFNKKYPQTGSEKAYPLEAHSDSNQPGHDLLDPEPHAILRAPNWGYPLLWTYLKLSTRSSRTKALPSILTQFWTQPSWWK